MNAVRNQISFDLNLEISDAINSYLKNGKPESTFKVANVIAEIFTSKEMSPATKFRLKRAGGTALAIAGKIMVNSRDSAGGEAAFGAGVVLGAVGLLIRHKVKKDYNKALLPDALTGVVNIMIDTNYATPELKELASDNEVQEILKNDKGLMKTLNSLKPEELMAVAKAAYSSESLEQVKDNDMNYDNVVKLADFRKPLKP